MVKNEDEDDEFDNDHDGADMVIESVMMIELVSLWLFMLRYIVSELLLLCYILLV